MDPIRIYKRNIFIVSALVNINIYLYLLQSSCLRTRWNTDEWTLNPFTSGSECNMCSKLKLIELVTVQCCHC